MTGVLETAVDAADALRQACPSAEPRIHAQLGDIYDARNPYVEAGAIADHLVDSMLKRQVSCLTTVIEAAEKILNEGGLEARRVVVFGLLEGIQNVALNEGMDLSSFEGHLGETVGRAWRSLIAIWEGQSAVDDSLF